MLQQQLELFTQRLPAWTRATDELTWGTRILPKIQAIQRRYIQPNYSTRKTWIVVDVDRPGGGYDWDLREAPAPNIVAENIENLHAHLFYGLEVPIHTDPAAHVKPLRYAAAIEHALVGKLGGDYGYVGLLAKNPLCRHWRVRTYQDYLYDLDWLADGLDLSRYRDGRRRMPAYGLGRNCTLFENLRLWSYRARLRVDWPSWAAWYTCCLEQAAGFNIFPAPLPMSEVRAVAKSVSKWTWANITPEGFSAVQRARCNRLNEIRRARANGKRQLLLALADGRSNHELARMTGIPRPTIIRLKRGGPHAISDTVLDSPLFRDSLQTERTTRETAGEA